MVSTEELITGVKYGPEYFMAEGGLNVSLRVGASAALRLHPHCKPCPNLDGSGCPPVPPPPPPPLE